MTMRLPFIVSLALLAGFAAASPQSGCQRAGGVWRPAKGPILATCRISINFEGRTRTVNVYLPSGYDGSRRYPLWIHLHGVFWNTMGGIAKQVGGPVNAADITPTWDKTVQMFGDRAIIAYPQSLGNPGQGDPSEGQGAKFRQFWNTPFWRCSLGICAENVNDLGFLDSVIKTLPQRFAVKPRQVLLTGTSSGSMMLHSLLCQSQAAASSVTAAVDVLGGVGRDFAANSCWQATNTPYLSMHGINDPSILYNAPVLVDGVPFLSAIDTARHRARKNGCNPDTDAGPTIKNAQTECTDFCGRKPGARPAKICGMIGVKHDTDHPWPGFAFQNAWQFFQQAISASSQGGGRSQETFRTG